MHSTPGNSMDSASSPDPCMPTPIMPKRTRSPAAVSEDAQSGSGSNRKVLFARDAPATAALSPRKLRREYLVMFLISKWVGCLEIVRSAGTIHRPYLHYLEPGIMTDHLTTAIQQAFQKESHR